MPTPLEVIPYKPSSDKKVLRYPLAEIHEKTDYLRIDIIKYKPIGNDMVNAPGARRNQGPRQGKSKIKTILLPIPSNIRDGNTTKYGDSSLNSVGAALIGGVMNTMESGGDYVSDFKYGLNSTTQKVVNALEHITNAAGGMEGTKAFITRQLASKAAGIAGVNITPDQLLARTTGEILNPNMELLFNGPTLRSFKFSFKMTPRGRKEAMEIKNIIRCFKTHMAPKVASAGDTFNTTFLSTPDVFELRYRQGAIEHKFLNKFKQCFMESIDVNYTADGTYATYDDGTPVSMVMTLSFKEIEPVYDVDYGDKITGVGY